MSTVPNWAQAFGISESEIAELKNQLDGNDDPLRWILANGYIPSDDYIKWAMDTYELPSVRDEYFGVPVDPVFWEAVKQEFPWSPAFFPLAEWQGVMLIGCLEPPQFHFPLRTPHRFVIAAAHALEHRFRELEPAPLVETHDEEISRDAVTVTDAKPLAQAAAAPQPRQRPADEILADSLPAAPDVDMHDPEGLVGGVNPDSNVNLAIPEGLGDQGNLKPVPTTPDGLDADSRLIDMSELDFSQTNGIALEPAPEPPKVQRPVMQELSIEPHAPPPAPKVPPGPPAAAVAAAAAAVKASTPPPAPPLSHARVAAAEPAVPLATCATLDSLQTAVVAHITSHFEHGMIMNFENFTLRPAKWSELMLSVKGDHPDAISLDQPSVFRIAARTSLPYHGYVVANPINTAFFNAFNRGVVPKHVTVMPAMVMGQTIGMLVGISMSEVDYKASLSAMEKIATEYATQFERLRSKGSAKAA